MRNFKEFIYEGSQVAFIPNGVYHWSVEPCVVTVEYRPYYTDGTPDPDPEMYDGRCMVECYPAVDDDYQISLDCLYKITMLDEPVYVIVGTKRMKKVGEVDGTDYSVIKDGDATRVLDFSEFDEERSLYELSFDELKELRNQICGGSLYISDYENNLGVCPEDLCDYYEEFWDYLCDKYGEDNAELHDTNAEFANYFYN